MLYWLEFDTSWGRCALVGGDRGARALFLPDSAGGSAGRAIAAEYPDAIQHARLLPDLVQRVRAYFEGERVDFHDPLDFSGVTDFRRRVYEACRRIPWGNTAAYRDLARAAGSERAVRAVGSAMASNRLPLIVPCHRVVRSDGSLGGFSAADGVSLKKRLLRLEGSSALRC